MTTVAWDGINLAADTLSQDNWGLIEHRSKIYKSDEWVAGGAGELHCLLNWYKVVKGFPVIEVVDAGIQNWDKDKNDPSIILVCRSSKQAWRLTGGVFVSIGRNFHAIGSGRDYALAAMYCGKSAAEAVQVAMNFDNNTGGTVMIAEID